MAHPPPHDGGGGQELDPSAMDMDDASHEQAQGHQSNDGFTVVVHRGRRQKSIMKSGALTGPADDIGNVGRIGELKLGYSVTLPLSLLNGKGPNSNGMRVKEALGVMGVRPMDAYVDKHKVADGRIVHHLIFYVVGTHDEHRRMPDHVLVEGHEPLPMARHVWSETEDGAINFHTAWVGPIGFGTQRVELKESLGRLWKVQSLHEEAARVHGSRFMRVSFESEADMEDALASKPVFVGRNYLSAYRAIADWKSQFEDAARTLTIIVPKDALAVIDRQKFAGKVIRTDNNRGRDFSIVHWLLDNPEDKAHALEFNGHHSLIGLRLRYFGRETKLCGACYSPITCQLIAVNGNGSNANVRVTNSPLGINRGSMGKERRIPACNPGSHLHRQPGAAGAGQGAVAAGQQGNGGGQQQQQREGLAANRGADLTMAGFAEIMRAHSEAKNGVSCNCSRSSRTSTRRRSECGGNKLNKFRFCARRSSISQSWWAKAEFATTWTSMERTTCDWSNRLNEQQQRWPRRSLEFSRIKLRPKRHIPRPSAVPHDQSPEDARQGSLHVGHLST
ncbi:hypothetical protein BCR44DRAFT_1459407 [Catenaria anguillulae PL171]|uniref:Uncharacterized protein n=1 Tax=Catenaria anguillulae PL171 TaxID=765915 RepID=A0A1Y2HYC8_9FUNG|nr:hypothetical protein BCR44DRAFT_1459407 [Catenaria anguillulae PL171]